MVANILINVHFVECCVDSEYCRMNFKPRLDISHKVQRETVRCFNLRVCFSLLYREEPKATRDCGLTLFEE